MNDDELLNEWESGEDTGLRPERIQQVRDDLSRVIEGPVPRRLPAIENWLERMKPQITRKLRLAADENGDEEE